MRFTLSFIALAALYVLPASAHMKMATPVPFDKSSLDNSPLIADGSDFPCKHKPGQAYNAEGASNVMPIGANQTLSFIGSAVHGGGSCQISLTTDNPPTQSTKWMVIHSIEGGCPASAAGNLPENPNGGGASQFQFSIPEGIKAGDYVLAWTWFNKIGNREMYMNCAPVTVTGGSKKRDENADIAPSTLTERADATFPNMFVANIPAGNPCTVQESHDVKFPNPGNSVQQAGNAADLLAAPSACPADGGMTGGGGSGTPASSAPAGGAPSTPVASSPVAATTLATSTLAASAGSFLQPTGGPNMSAPAAASPSAVAPPVSLSQPSATPAAPSAPATGSPSTGAPSTSGSSCSTPGVEVCSSDGTMIGMCDQMSHVVFTPVASGTKCVNGNMVYARDYSGRYAQGHVRRNAHGRW